MKIYFYIILSSIIFIACSKSSSMSNPGNSWQLVQKTFAIGFFERVLTPSKDSSVLLVLDNFNGYISELNGKVISRGTYSINTAAYNQEPYLELNNFKTTGIFSLFVVSGIGANNQVVSTFDGLFMNLSHDTLTLTGALTPGGSESYTLVKAK